MLILLAWFIAPAAFGQAPQAREGGAPLAGAVRSVVSVLPQWPPDVRRTEAPEGSGVVVFDGSSILTALHVVDKALSVKVRTSDGDILPARVAGRDQATDLALLAIDVKLPALAMAGEMETGDEVCAIGNAFGLGLSLTCGVVSGVNRAGLGFNPIEDFVQTDAAVNPGSSGGALVTGDGRLAGILSAIFTKASDSNIGVNFAISAPLAARVGEALRATGAVRWLAAGFRLVEGVSDGETGRLGARVETVRSGTPAKAAGFAPGDLLVEAGGRRIRKPADFVSRMAHVAEPGELAVTILRAREQHILTLRFGRAP